MLDGWKRVDGEDVREFEGMIREALSRIPLYGSEWTNYQVSDPGIAVLENLTAFQALQRSGVRRVSDEALEGLCRLAGFEKERGAAAQVWLAAAEGESGAGRLLPNQKFYGGGICFEVEERTEPGVGGIEGVLLEEDGKIRDVSGQVAGAGPGGVYPFGERPVAGKCVYLILRSLPAPGEWLRIMVRTKQPFPRNRMSVTESGLFAYLGWSLYTEHGFRKIECRDESGAFLQDGMISLKMPAEEGCVYRRFSREGYVLRCRLVREEYDMAPRVVSFQGPLFPVRQRDSLAVTLAFDRAEGFVAENAMLEGSHLTVYGLERDGFYHEYKEAGEERCFFREKTEKGVCRFTLEGRNLVRKAEEDEACAVLTLRSGAVLPHYRVGRIYGYRDETLSLEPIAHILPEDFLVAVCVDRPDGGKGYRFFRPGDRGRGALHYTLLAEEGAIRIEDPGDFEEAELLLCSCAVHLGEKGNIRAGNLFYPKGSEEEAPFYNPAAGNGGRYEEDIRSVGGRIAADLRKTAGLARLTDYEEMVRGIPGLCIHKVKAFAAADGQEVRVAVKPCAGEPFPDLSPLYRRVIETEAEKRRMLATKVTLLSPVYIPVDVSGRIHLKPYFPQGREQVEAALRDLLDCVSSGRDFGSTLSFHEICRALEALDCVEEIYSLHLRPRTGNCIQMQGADIRMTEGGLCYPGRLELEYGMK